MTHPRGLSPDEAAAWERVAKTVEPLERANGDSANHVNAYKATLNAPSYSPALQNNDKAASGGRAKESERASGPSPSQFAQLMAGTPAISQALSVRKESGWLLNGARPGAQRGSAKTAGISGGLDSHWERNIKSGTLAPDFTLDLHGHSLASAHQRLDQGLMQAKALGARVVLVVTGRARSAEAADRGERRGAIRAKILDWLAAGPHSSDIAAVRAAHRKHGGAGALYLVLRRRR